MQGRLALATVVTGAILVSAALHGQTGGSGKELFERRCGGCHALDRDKEGPALRGIYGRTAGASADFPYSEALRKSGIRWNAETLDRWLTDTGKLVPDNDMAFRVENPGERSQIIAYLKEISGR